MEGTGVKTITFAIPCYNSAEYMDKCIESILAFEDGSGDIILRLYESKHASCSAALTLNIPAAKVYACDMLENVQEELPVTGGQVQLSFRGFEIKTVRVKRY